MLVLTRKIGQQILVNNGTIKFKVLGVKNDQICLGVLAPEGVDIDREEIFYRKQAQNVQPSHKR